MKSAIIIGASSGIGRALAHQLARDGWRLGLTGRRVALLETLCAELRGEHLVRAMDVTAHGEAEAALVALADDLGGVDLVIVNAGVGMPNPALDPAQELAMIDTNARGFAMMAGAAFRYFRARLGDGGGRGHIAGISSIAALRGNPVAPAYGATKAFASNYLEGLRLMALRDRLDIAVTDIQPGFVDTDMIKGQSQAFWIASAAEAARQIAAAIDAKRPHAYITRRWRLMAWAMRLAPAKLLARV